MNEAKELRDFYRERPEEFYLGKNRFVLEGNVEVVSYRYLSVGDKVAYLLQRQGGRKPKVYCGVINNLYRYKSLDEKLMDVYLAEVNFGGAIGIVVAEQLRKR